MQILFEKFESQVINEIKQLANEIIDNLSENATRLLNPSELRISLPYFPGTRNDLKPYANGKGVRCLNISFFNSDITRLGGWELYFYSNQSQLNLRPSTPHKPIDDFLENHKEVIMDFLMTELILSQKENPTLGYLHQPFNYNILVKYFGPDEGLKISMKFFDFTNDIRFLSDDVAELFIF